MAGDRHSVFDLEARVDPTWSERVTWPRLIDREEGKDCQKDKIVGRQAMASGVHCWQRLAQVRAGTGGDCKGGRRVPCERLLHLRRSHSSRRGQVDSALLSVLQKGGGCVSGWVELLQLRSRGAIMAKTGGLVEM
jgi:hypothetical protein